MSNDGAVDVSLLVPAKDEAENLPEFVRLCGEYLSTGRFSFEVVIVNDGSRDQSAEVLTDLQRRFPFLRVVTHRRQRGIADALTSAGEIARGDIFVFYPHWSTRSSPERPTS
jgi:glycosyltransferase involved in cell wall biosynthesis